MRILSTGSPEFRRLQKRFNRHYTPETAVTGTVAAIISDIQARGDLALIDLTEKFGGPRLKPSQLLVPPAEREAARAAIDAATRRAIRAAHKNIRAFAQKGLRKSWTGKNTEGASVGERFDPFRRVGIYVPGGSAPLASTGLMTATYAAVAGVPEIVVVSPCGPHGELNPALVAALDLAGATEIYRVGGAQAIGALAFGTKTIAPVDKIFGPGNAYVVEAKRQVFGRVAVDLLPGPSEILVVCDNTANPAWVAADLLAQAEHGADSLAIAVSPSMPVLRKIESEINQQAERLSRRQQIEGALRSNVLLVHCNGMGEAIRLANAFAPEHLTIVAKDDARLAAGVYSAGAIFLGPFSPVAAGDFLAGPSHELPTGGAGKAFAGLTTDQFQRRTSIVRYDQRALAKSVSAIATFSRLEGLDGHGRSATIRLEEPGSTKSSPRA